MACRCCQCNHLVVSCMRSGVCCEAALDAAALIISMAIYSARAGACVPFNAAGVCVVGVQDLCVPGQL